MKRILVGVTLVVGLTLLAAGCAFDKFRMSIDSGALKPTGINSPTYLYDTNSL